LSSNPTNLITKNIPPPSRNEEGEIIGKEWWMPLFIHSQRQKNFQMLVDRLEKKAVRESFAAGLIIRSDSIATIRAMQDTSWDQMSIGLGQNNDHQNSVMTTSVREKNRRSRNKRKPSSRRKNRHKRDRVRELTMASDNGTSFSMSNETKPMSVSADITHSPVQTTVCSFVGTFYRSH
jgi:hypothetical protein